VINLNIKNHKFTISNYRNYANTNYLYYCEKCGMFAEKYGSNYVKVYYNVNIKDNMHWNYFDKEELLSCEEFIIKNIIE